MKTTMVFPDDLMMEVKLEAVRQHCKLKDLVAELIRLGLEVKRQVPGAGLHCRDAGAVWLTDLQSIGASIEAKKNKGKSLVATLEADRGSRG